MSVIADTNPIYNANRQFVDAVYKQAYGTYATPEALKQYVGKKVYEVTNGLLGGKSPFKNFTGQQNPNTPIPVKALNGTQGLSEVLGVAIPKGSVNSDVAGLLSLYGQNTKSQDQYDELTKQLTEATQKLGGQAGDMTAALNEQGVPQAFEQAKQLNLRGAQIQGELEAFDAETKQISANLDGQAIPTGLIQGQQAELNKQRDLTRSSKAAELASTIALSQAYQGNAAIGRDLATQSVALKYAPLQNEIDTLTQQLGFAKDKMSAEDQKRATIIEQLISSKQSELDFKKSQEMKIQDLAIEAAANGAPLALINSLKGITDPARAASALSKYLSATLKTKGSGSGSKEDPFSPGFRDAKIESDVRADAVALLDQVTAGAMTLDQVYTKLRKLYSPKEVSDEALKELLGVGVPGTETNTPTSKTNPQSLTAGLSKAGAAVGKIGNKLYDLPSPFTVAKNAGKKVVSSIGSFLFGKKK